jgi:hypothetical protein
MSVNEWPKRIGLSFHFIFFFPTRQLHSLSSLNGGRSSIHRTTFERSFDKTTQPQKENETKAFGQAREEEKKKFHENHTFGYRAIPKHLKHTPTPPPSLEEKESTRQRFFFLFERSASVKYKITTWVFSVSD